MMTQPYYYTLLFIDSSYEELMVERDRLVKSIKEYEDLLKKNDRTGEEWFISPDPGEAYQASLEYLAQLSILMHEKCTQMFLLGNSSLSEGNNDYSHKSKLNRQMIMVSDPIDPNVIRVKLEESRPEIQRSLRAIKLPEDIKQKVISGEISIEDAINKYLPQG